MVLESLNSNRVNIKDLVLEEPSRRIEELIFDPEKEVTQEDWEAIYNDFYTRNDSFNQLSRLHAIKMLFPKRMEEFDMVESIYHAGISYVNNIGNVDFYTKKRALEVLASTIILFPEKKKEIDNIAEKFKEEVLTGLLNTNDLAFCDEYLNFAIVFPKEVLPIIRSSEEIKDFLASGVEFRRTELNVHWLIASIFAAFKLLFPDRGLEISKKEWDTMKEGLNFYRRREQWFDFVTLALGMKILAAEKARITDDGVIEIIPQTQASFIQPIPSLPEIRKF